MVGIDTTASANGRLAHYPYSIGLTGGIGSGKSTVADLFAAIGVPIIDTDVIAHALTNTDGAAMPAISAAFGTSFVTTDGALDRGHMRTVVFSDPMARKRLEAILHPLIAHEAQHAAQIAATNDAGYLIYVVPLLVESNQWRDRVDRILVVDCEEATQLERVMRRNGMSTAQAAAIMAAQATRSERLAAADDVIDNNGDAARLTRRVARLHAQYQIQARALPGAPATDSKL
ncbi:MAG: dephospho-CoA kinase [Pseudomonadota bacterium]